MAGNSPVLILGCAGVGKSLIVRQLKSLVGTGGLSKQFETASTAGVELDSVSVLRPSKKPGEDGSVLLGVITIREVGSPMLPMWPSYYDEARSVVFVVDTAQPFGIAAATVELFDVLSHPKLAGKPCLLVLNKCDVPGRMSRESVDDVMRLPDLIASQRSRRVFDVVELSGVSGAGFPALLEWLLPGAGPLYPV